MTKQEFFEKLEDVLQLEAGTIREDLFINEIPDFDSMAWLSIIAMIDEEMNITLPIDKLLEAEKVSDIMELAGII